MGGGERADGEEPAVGAGPRDGRAGPSALASCSACRGRDEGWAALRRSSMRVMSLGVMTPARCLSLKTSARRSAHSVRRGGRSATESGCPTAPAHVNSCSASHNSPLARGNPGHGYVVCSRCRAPQPRRPEAKVPLAAAGRLHRGLQRETFTPIDRPMPGPAVEWPAWRTPGRGIQAPVSDQYDSSTARLACQLVTSRRHPAGDGRGPPAAQVPWPWARLAGGCHRRH